MEAVLGLWPAKLHFTPAIVCIRACVTRVSAPRDVTQLPILFPCRPDQGAASSYTNMIPSPVCDPRILP